MTRFALAGLASLALLAGCTQQPTEPTATPTVTATATVTVTATPSPTAESTPTPTPTPTAESVGKTCADYPALPSSDDDASAAIESAASAALGNDALGAHVVANTDAAGMIDVVVRVCADQPIARQELVDNATAIAIRIRQTATAETIANLVVSSWHPDGEYLGQGEAVTTDYQLFTWDPATTLPSNWK